MIGRYEFELELEFELEFELELFEELELELFDEFELELFDEFELELFDEFEFELELELLDEFEFELLDEPPPPRARLTSSIVAGVHAAPPMTAVAAMATALSRHGVRPVLGMMFSSGVSAASIAALTTVVAADETAMRAP